MNKESIDLNRLRNLVKNRLLLVPEEIRRFLPPVLSKPKVGLFTYPTDTYFILAFVDAVERERIQKLTEKGYHPFPGLIKPHTGNSVSVAFKLANSRNVLIQANTVKNLFSFSLGKDCTLILRDHKQSINTKELGIYEYTINLAYIISFGDEINSDNLYDYVEDLIAYSFKQWRSGNVGEAPRE